MGALCTVFCCRLASFDSVLEHDDLASSVMTRPSGDKHVDGVLARGNFGEKELWREKIKMSSHGCA